MRHRRLSLCGAVLPKSFSFTNNFLHLTSCQLNFDPNLAMTPGLGYENRKTIWSAKVQLL